MRSILLIALVSVACAAGFFAIMGYSGYKHYTGKYLQVEVANCSKVKHLMDEELKEFPTLKKALEIAEMEGKSLLKISVEEFNRISSLSGSCIEYKGKTYRIYLMTP